MKELILSKWDEILSLLETEHGLSHIVINTWIKPLKLYSVEGKKLYFTIDEQMGARRREPKARGAFPSACQQSTRTRKSATAIIYGSRIFTHISMTTVGLGSLWPLPRPIVQDGTRTYANNWFARAM